MTNLVGIDLGKTACRVRVVADGEVVTEVTGGGAVGLADPGGSEAAVAAVAATLDRVQVGDSGSVAIGAAGAEAAPAEARALAERLADRLPGWSVAVASDSLTAHVGALGGGAGTVLAVGTGSVALGLSAGGELMRVDGWGPWLGDHGSGAAMGRAALQAALRAHEGWGPATLLTKCARARFGDLVALPRTLAEEGAVARAMATFAPDVLSCAAAGDSVARSVVEDALGSWVRLTAAAARAVAEPVVTVVGGLAGDPDLVERWAALLPPHLTPVAAAGTPLDGAVALAGRTDLPHERHVLRRAGAEAAAVAVAGTAPAGTERHRTDDVDVLATEQVRRDLADLDARDAADLVHVLLEAEATVPTALAGATPALTTAVRLAADALDAGGRIVYVGAGTPGRLAALDAAECPPTFGTDPGQVVAVLAGGGEATARAVEGAEDDAVAGARDLTALGLTAHDVVVGITASGRTPYVLAALDTAHAAGCRTVAVVNNPGSPAAARADVAVELLTGAEVLAGSTRLKAGSSQKVALNVISTGAMVRAGKTYGAWMVDVVASNEKLRRRARRILREATGVNDARAVATLEAAGWRTKPALVALLSGTDVDRAREALAVSSGRVREALSKLGRDEGAGS